MDGVYTMMVMKNKKMEPVFSFVIEKGVIEHSEPKNAGGLDMYPEGPLTDDLERKIKMGLYGGSYWHLEREDLDHLKQFGEAIQRLGLKVGHLAYNPLLDKMMPIKSIDRNGVVSFYQPAGTATDTAKYHISLAELERLTQKKILRPWE